MKQIYLIGCLGFFLFPFSSFAQIFVLDAASKLPIVNATISDGDQNVLKITDERGTFDLDEVKISQPKKLIITSIAYQKRNVDIGSLKNIDSIYLTPVVYDLKEVSITSKKYRKHLVGGGMTLMHGDNHYGTYGYEEARFFPNEYDKDSEIIAVQYFVVVKQPFQKKTKVDLNNVFGISVYEANADGSPGKPLLTEDILVKAEKHAEWVVVNLEQYHLPVPEYGFVVGFKIFPASFYVQKNGFVKSEDMVTPKLAIKTYLRKSNDAWRRNLIRNSRWQKEDRSHFGIRAMIAEPK
ncbi:hypothetical protein ACQKCH_00275 [Nubsella zeaxanthinifaciens]|uniref:hypothetical protein n=1 Tax=Nubsella zeaxanthinifaciens TaxID=392412 RepID=UPI003D02CD97